jgi:hypothetical protein
MAASITAFSDVQRSARSTWSHVFGWVFWSFPRRAIFLNSIQMTEFVTAATTRLIIVTRPLLRLLSH